MMRSLTILCLPIGFHSDTTVEAAGGIFDIVKNIQDSVTETPSVQPTYRPSLSPTFPPTVFKSQTPSNFPSITISMSPSALPSMSPTKFPTAQPSNAPTVAPSEAPTAFPTLSPSAKPSVAPTRLPTSSPSTYPSQYPTVSPTLFPSSSPSSSPSSAPTSKPTEIPSLSIGDIGNKLLYDSKNGIYPAVSERKRNIAFIIIGSCLIAMVAVLVGVVLFANFFRRRNNAQNLIDVNKYIDNDNDLDEISIPDAFQDNNSQCDASTIKTEKTSVWKRRMQNILEQEEVDGVSKIDPSSVFQASTIKSEGSWIRHSEIPTLKIQSSSVMDIDFFDDKPIPDHVMCVQSESDL